MPVCLCTAVGLSYSDNHADYATNDTATAADSHRFLRQFFTLYPHLQANDFYISGEGWPARMLLDMIAPPRRNFTCWQWQPLKTCHDQMGHGLCNINTHKHLVCSVILANSHDQGQMNDTLKSCPLQLACQKVIHPDMHMICAGQKCMTEGSARSSNMCEYVSFSAG